MEGNYISAKLNKFNTLVLTDAREKRSELMQEVEKQYSERIDEKETELLEGAYNSIQHTIREARKDANEKVLHTETDSRKKLIIKREELIEEVMTEAKEKLAQFTKNADYERWLLDKTEKAFSELGEGAKTVYISSDDAKLKEKIEKLAENVTVEVLSPHGVSGGVKVTNTDKRVAVDYTFKELIGEQKQKFLRESGLAID